ncbi:MAG: 3-isopropylmalate dehydratase large subunit [Spirochaetia bacterium]|jgi:3-isopropylmalate/(R)-2-methylmalate dehydratase large subunit
MSMTLSEKILSRAAGGRAVKPGEFLEVEPDLGLANDITAPIAIQEFEKTGADPRFPDRIWLVPDHFTPNKDILSAQQVKMMRDFSRRHPGIRFFEQNEVGVEHALLPEMGAVVPGMVMIGADSHTCTAGALGAFATGMGSTDLAGFFLTGKAWIRVPHSIRVEFTGVLRPWVTGKDLILTLIGRIGVSGATYKALEICGPAIDELSVEARLTMANMAVEAGAKNGIFMADAKVEEFLKGKTGRTWERVEADPDAEYERRVAIDVSELEPVVAAPFMPQNVHPASEKKDIAVDQVVIGSCTNGRIEDLRAAAQLLRGRKVARGVRCIVIPATPKVYRQALNEGLFDVFLDAGAVISTPTCGPCLGGHMGILAEGERCVSTTNRNFVGRMGHRTSEVYLASPATAAASAIAGRIASPSELAVMSPRQPAASGRKGNEECD